MRERLALCFCEAGNAVDIATMLLGFWARRPVLVAVAGIGSEVSLGSSIAVVVAVGCRSVFDTTMRRFDVSGDVYLKRIFQIRMKKNFIFWSKKMKNNEISMDFDDFDINF